MKPDLTDSDAAVQSRRTGWLIGLATLGTAIAGVASLLVALFAFVSGQWQSAGLCLLAAAFAFGLLANALLRR
jgi:hypothetical protein